MLQVLLAVFLLLSASQGATPGPKSYFDISIEPGQFGTAISPSLMDTQNCLVGCITSAAPPVLDFSLWPGVCLSYFNETSNPVAVTRGSLVPNYVTVYQYADNGGEGCDYTLAFWTSTPCEKGLYGVSCEVPAPLPTTATVVQSGQSLFFEAPFDPEVRFPNVTWLDFEIAAAQSDPGASLLICTRSYDFPDYTREVYDGGACTTVTVAQGSARIEVITRPRMYKVVYDDSGVYIPLFVQVIASGGNVAFSVSGSETECEVLAQCPNTMPWIEVDQTVKLTFATSPSRFFKLSVYDDDLPITVRFNVTAGAMKAYFRYGANPNIAAGDWDMATPEIAAGTSFDYYFGAYPQFDKSCWIIQVVPTDPSLPVSEQYGIVTVLNIAPSPTAPGKEPLSGGAIAGIVIGVLCAVFLLVGGAVFFIRRSRGPYTSIQ